MWYLNSIVHNSNFVDVKWLNVRFKIIQTIGSTFIIVRFFKYFRFYVSEEAMIYVITGLLWITGLKGSGLKTCICCFDNSINTRGIPHKDKYISKKALDFDRICIRRVFSFSRRVKIFFRLLSSSLSIKDCQYFFTKTVFFLFFFFCDRFHSDQSNFFNSNNDLHSCIILFFLFLIFFRYLFYQHLSISIQMDTRKFSNSYFFVEILCNRLGLGGYPDSLTWKIMKILRNILW